MLKYRIQTHLQACDVVPKPLRGPQTFAWALFGTLKSLLSLSDLLQRGYPRQWKDINEGHAGFLGQLLAAQDLLQQWLFDGLTGVTPQLVLPAALGDHDPTECVLGRRSGGKGKARGKMERLQG